MSLPTPSPTLYVSGLETKTKKTELRSTLYALFTPYGQILDIVAKKHAGGRGQAFVVFAEQAAATAAMRALSGELFYGKELRITYAKSPSNATLARTDPSASREAAAIKAAKLVVSRAQGEYEAMEAEAEAGADGEGGAEGVANGENTGGATSKRAGEEVDGDERGAKRAKVAATGDEEEEEEMEIEMEDDEDALPTANGTTSGTTLICTNLPPECNEDIMAALYGQYQGFTKATALPPSVSPPSSHPPANPGAKSYSISFASPQQANQALEATNKYLMQPGWEMGVSVR